MDSLKPDCSYALRRKRLQSLPAAMSRTLSPVRFERKRCGIARISRNFKSNPGGFLCTSDCVAERKTFEPSVPFLNDLNGDVSVSCTGSTTFGESEDCALAAQSC